MPNENDGSFYRGKRILVTGGAGFIGSSIAIELVRLGGQVTVLDAMLPLYGGNLFNLEQVANQINFVRGDIRDRALLDRLMPGTDVVFNLAAQVSYIDSRDLPFLDLDINARGQLNVLESMRLHAPQATLVFSSSRLVYGKILTNPVSEDHPTDPLSLYGIHKLAGEKYCRYYSRTFGLRTVVVRIPNPYGPRQQMKHSKYSIVGWFLRQAMEDATIKIFGDGQQDRDYIYIDDIVQAIIALGEVGRTGEVYNIGTSEKVKFVGMVDAILDAVGHGRKELVPWPKDYERNETGNYYADTSKIERETGWKAKVPLAEGIRRMAEYYQLNRAHYWTTGEHLALQMETVARDYMDTKFPRATQAERDKIVNDWVTKADRSPAIVDDFRRRIGDPAGMRILDSGSGPGGTALAFSDAGADVAGVDVEQELITIAQQVAAGRDRKPTFTYYDGDVLPFDTGSFDAAVSTSVLEHVTDPVGYLAEILRVLKPGGSLYLAFPNRMWPRETHTRLWFVTYLPRYLTDKAVRLMGRNPLEDNNLHFYTYWKLVRMVRQSQAGGEFRWVMKPEEGTTASPVKKLAKKLLGAVGISYKAFLPHVSVVLVKV